jgi:hypothetical protein
VRHDATDESFRGTGGFGTPGFCLGRLRGRTVPVGGPRSGRYHQKPHRRLRRPRQGDGPYLASGNSHRSDRGVRRAESDAPGLRFAPPHRDAAYGLLRRSGRDHAHRRRAADLHGLDVRREPRASRRGASGLRRLAHELQDARGVHAAGKHGECAAGRGAVGACRRGGRAAAGTGRTTAGRTAAG